VAPQLDGTADEAWNRYPFFNELHLGKRSVTLDLSDTLGRATLLDLVRVSDVLLENFSPRVMGNFDLEWGQLRAENPRLIFVSMPAFGKNGPHRDRVSYGPGIDAMSGLSWLTGYSDGAPLKPGNFYCDQNAGLHAAFATVSALRERDRTGRGQTVELAMLEGELQLLGDALVSYQLNGREPTRVGNDHSSMAPHDVLPAQGNDAWIAISCRDDADWEALLRLVTQDDEERGTALEQDLRYATALRRWKNRTELRKSLSPWTNAQDPSILAVRLQRRGIPASSVHGSRDLLRDQQFLARAVAPAVQHPQVGPTPAPRPAFRLSGTPSPPTGAAPLFAADNDYVFRVLLGYDQERIDSLCEAGVTSYELLEHPR
jgi:crotonobetainyl-CoA:carnitine CoA-transferase CaiB-like acyl-CoA transferase